jgi:hypothetical protein
MIEQILTFFSTSVTATTPSDENYTEESKTTRYKYLCQVFTTLTYPNYLH